MVDQIRISNVKGGEVASEATLKQLLLALSGSGSTFNNEKTARAINDMMRKSGGSVAEASKALEESLKKASTAIPATTRKFRDFIDRGVEKPLSTLGDPITKTVNGISNLIPNLGGFGTALKVLVGAGGGLFGSLVGFMQNNIDAFRSISEVGAGFSGNLIDMRRTAAEGNMSLTEFVNIIKQNSDVLAQMGGSVTLGTKMFTKLSKDVSYFDSQRLASLGYSFDEMNDLIIKYIDSTKLATTEDGRQSIVTKKVTKDIVEYGKELNILSELTGKSRKQIADQTAQELKRGQNLAYLDSLTDEQRSSYLSVNTMLGAFSPTLQKANLALSAFGGYLAEESQDIAIYAPNLNRSLDNFRQIIDKGGKITSKELHEMATDFAKDLPSINQYARLGNETAIRLREDLQGLTRLSSMSQDQLKAFLKSIDDENRGRQASQASFLKLDTAFRSIRGRIEETLFKEGGGLEAFVNKIGNLLDSITPEDIERFMKPILGYLDDFSKWLGKIINSKNPLDTITADVVDFFRNIMPVIIREVIDSVRKYFSGDKPAPPKSTKVIDIPPGVQTYESFTKEQEERYANHSKDSTAYKRMKERNLELYKEMLHRWYHLSPEQIEAMVPQRAMGGGTGQGGLFRLHANEYVLNERMIENLNSMSASMAESLTARDSIDAREAKGTRELNTSDYSRPEREQFVINQESRDYMRILTELQERYMEKFDNHMLILDEINRTLKDQLELFESGT